MPLVDPRSVTTAEPWSAPEPGRTSRWVEEISWCGLGTVTSRGCSPAPKRRASGARPTSTARSTSTVSPLGEDQPRDRSRGHGGRLRLPRDPVRSSPTGRAGCVGVVPAARAAVVARPGGPGPAHGAAGADRRGRWSCLRPGRREHLGLLASGLRACRPVDRRGRAGRSAGRRGGRSQVAPASAPARPPARDVLGRDGVGGVGRLGLVHGRRGDGGVRRLVDPADPDQPGRRARDRVPSTSSTSTRCERTPVTRRSAQVVAVDPSSDLLTVGRGEDDPHRPADHRLRDAVGGAPEDEARQVAQPARPAARRGPRRSRRRRRRPPTARRPARAPTAGAGRWRRSPKHAVPVPGPVGPGRGGRRRGRSRQGSQFLFEAHSRAARPRTRRRSAIPPHRPRPPSRCRDHRPPAPRHQPVGRVTRVAALGEHRLDRRVVDHPVDAVGAEQQAARPTGSGSRK